MAKKLPTWQAMVQANTAGLTVADLGGDCSAVPRGTKPEGAVQDIWNWQRTIMSAPVGYVTLQHPDGELRARVLCQQGRWRSTRVLHPGDAGAFVRAVAPYMRNAPSWAVKASQVWVDRDTPVSAGVLPFLPGQWVCPECLPTRNYSAAGSTYVQGPCPPGDPELRQMYGYDTRAMRPWAQNVGARGQCYQGGPGGPDTLCMPSDSAGDGSFAEQYRVDFWHDVGQAATAYNADVAAGKVPLGYVPPKRSWLPLLAFGIGTGVLGVALWNSRR